MRESWQFCCPRNTWTTFPHMQFPSISCHLNLWPSLRRWSILLCLIWPR